MDSKNKNLILFVGVAVLSFFGYLWLINQGFFQDFISWSQENIIVYFVILVLMKILAIVWPPIPGGLLTLGSIPVIGWQLSYLADVLGGFIGASIAYYLGKTYGREFLQKLFDEPALAQLDRIKVIKNREVEAIAVLRVFYGTISEVISYGSGLLGVSFKNFALGIFFSALATLPLYYVVNNLFNGSTGVGLILNGGILVAALILFFKFKGRYFE